jgi:hypothetical protein
MISFCLFTPDLTKAFNGSYSQCVALGGEITAQSEHELLKVARVRPGEREALVVTEITSERVKQTSPVRTVCAKTLRSLCRSSPLVLRT